MQSQLDLTLDSGRENNFDFIRLIAAVVVLFSHSFPLSGGAQAIEPVKYLTSGQMTFGEAAVYVFFFLSGYMVTGSFERSRGLGHFLWKRCLRLFPALIVVVLLTMFILGPLLTERSIQTYFTDRAFLRYATNIFLFPVYELPGVFENNPYPSAINGSLWTLRYEFLCYLVIGLLGFSSVLRWPFVAVLVITAALVQCLLSPAAIGSMPFTATRMFIDFGAGACAYLLRRHIPLNAWAGIASLAVLVALSWSGFMRAALPIFGGYAILCFAFLGNSLYRRTTEYGDVSYGMYVYAFPLQQTVVALIGGGPWWLNFLIVMPATLALAFLSWTIVEKPALAAKNFNLRSLTAR